MERSGNEIQFSEISSAQEAIEERQERDIDERIAITERMFQMLQETTDRVRDVNSSTANYRGEVQREMDNMTACDNRIANTNEEIRRKKARLVEIKALVDTWHGKVNSCLFELNNACIKNRAAKMREKKILALMEEEKKLMAEP